VRHCARSYHFVIAVWRAKEAKSRAKLINCTNGPTSSLKKSRSVKNSIRGHGRGAGVGGRLGVGVSLGVEVAVGVGVIVGVGVGADTAKAYTLLSPAT